MLPLLEELVYLFLTIQFSGQHVGPDDCSRTFWRGYFGQGEATTVSLVIFILFTFQAQLSVGHSRRVRLRFLCGSFPSRKWWRCGTQLVVFSCFSQVFAARQRINEYLTHRKCLGYGEMDQLAVYNKSNIGRETFEVRNNCSPNNPPSCL